jgi:hypothetical protein
MNLFHSSLLDDDSNVVEVEFFVICFWPKFKRTFYSLWTYIDSTGIFPLWDLQRWFPFILWLDSLARGINCLKRVYRNSRKPRIWLYSLSCSAWWRKSLDARHLWILLSTSPAFLSSPWVCGCTWICSEDLFDILLLVNKIVTPIVGEEVILV